jgi:hypothetical protein
VLSASAVLTVISTQSDVGIEHDIQLAKCMWDEVTVASGHSLAPLYYSLREYTSVLYLNPRMQVRLPPTMAPPRTHLTMLSPPVTCMCVHSYITDLDPRA